MVYRRIIDNRLDTDIQIYLRSRRRTRRRRRFKNDSKGVVYSLKALGARDRSVVIVFSFSWILVILLFVGKIGRSVRKEELITDTLE